MTHCCVDRLQRVRTCTVSVRLHQALGVGPAMQAFWHLVWLWSPGVLVASVTQRVGGFGH